MNNELVTIELFIKKHYKTTVHTPITEKALNEILTKVEQIKSTWLKTAALTLLPKKIKPAIIQAQQTIITLNEYISNYLEEQNITPDTALQSIILELEEMECLLETHYTQYLDLTKRIELSTQFKLLNRINKLLPILSSIKIKDKKAERLLAEYLLPLFQDVKNNPKRKFMFGKVFLLRELLEFLNDEISQSAQSPHITMQLINMTIFCNVNAIEMQAAIRSILQEEIDKQEDEIAQLTYIRQQYNHFSEMATKPYIYYDATQRTLKAQLTEWLGEKLKILEKEILEWETESYIEDGKIMKLETKLTVGELGLLTRLFIDYGIILNKKKKAVFQLFSKSIKTINKNYEESISPYKLWNSSYKPNIASLLSVKKILNLMAADVSKKILNSYKK